MGEKVSYITRVAATMIAQLKIVPHRIAGVENDTLFAHAPSVLWKREMFDVIQLIKHMNFSTLGIIVAYGLSGDQAEIRGKTSFWDVNPGLKLDLNGPGSFPLRTLAAMVIVAEMYDILRDRLLNGGSTTQFNKIEARQRANDAEEHNHYRYTD